MHTLGRRRAPGARWLVALAIVACLLVAALVSAPAVAAPSCGTTTGAWTTLVAPRFPAGKQALSAYAIAPRAPERVYATNGDTIVRSADGGCSWRNSLVLGEPEAPFAPQVADVVSLDVPEPARAQRRALALVAEEVGPAHRPHVLRSDDGGASWSPGDAGLPPVGRPEFLEVAPSDATTAYLGIDLGSGAVDALYASRDGGTTWTLRSGVDDYIAGGITGLAVDPLDRSELWAWGSGGLYRSADGGRSFTRVEELAGTRVAPVDVFHAPGEPARIVAFRPDHRDLLASADGGRRWLRIGTPGLVRSVAHGSVAESIYISTANKVFAFARGTYGWFDLEAPAAGIVDLSTDRLATPSLYGRNEGALFVFAPGPHSAPEPTVDELLDLDLSPVAQPPPRAAVLRPASSKLRIPVGDTKKVRYSLRLPEPRVPLDVFFLIDTSNSMDRFIASLLRGISGIIDGIEATGIDAQFGVGSYRAYPNSRPPRPAPLEANYVYRRGRDIGPVDESLERALEELRAEGGSFFYDAHLGALYQAATGEGQDLAPPGPLGHDVPPGLQANYRAKALRVLINASDEPFGRERNRDDAPDIPDFDVVAAALRARRIQQVGISITRDSDADLRRMAGATDAFASAGGVDCDGDELADLRRGDPLVCAMTRRTLEDADALVPAIVNLVKAVRDTSSVSLDVAGAQPILNSVDPPAYAGVVLQNSPVLTFDVSFRCERDRAGERFDVDLAARASQAVVARASALVICGEVDDPAPLPPPAIAVVDAIVGVVVVPPAPPPPLVPELASQVQSQSQAHAQAAAAQQEQEQPQFAFVHAGRTRQVEQSYAMSRLSPRDDAPQLTFVAATAVLMALGYAFASVARAKAEVQRAIRR